MAKYVTLSSFVILFFICACARKPDHRNLILTKLKFDNLGDDTIKISQKATFRLVLNDHNLKIKKAYFDCTIESDLQIDEVNYVLSNCIKELFINQDTIIIQLTPTAVGKKKFQEITVLAVDENDFISIHQGSFEYFVLE